MARREVSRILAHEPRFLFEIAADVAAYGAFVPLCREARVWDETVDSDGCRRFKAALRIVYPKLRLDETFVSDVRADPVRLTLKATSNTGPVKHIDNRWRFVATGNATRVGFSIDYQMSSRLLQVALSGAFDYALAKVMSAFEARADELALTADHP